MSVTMFTWVTFIDIKKENLSSISEVLDHAVTDFEWQKWILDKLEEKDMVKKKSAFGNVS